jgi:hypothetical protein
VLAHVDRDQVPRDFEYYRFDVPDDAVMAVQNQAAHARFAQIAVAADGPVNIDLRLLE